MPKSDNNLKAVLQDTANAIRGKTGASEPIIPRDFANEIENIPTGGGGDAAAIVEGTFSGPYNDAQITKVRTGAFTECSELTEINLPNVSIIGKEAFSECSGLLKANIPNVTIVQDSAFYSCVNLSSINAPGIISIGSSAFYCCSKLKEAVFSQCTYLGSSPFAGCVSLEKISFDALSGTLSYFAVNNNSHLSEVNLPNITTLSGNITFSNCSNLRIVNLPKLRSMRYCSSAFQNCPLTSELYFSQFSSVQACPSLFNNTGVERVHFPKYNDFNQGEARNGLFPNCSKLSYVKMETLLYLVQEFFLNCPSLTQISRENFPQLIQVGRGAFSSCINLSIFDVPTVSRLGSYPFIECTTLRKISLPCLWFSNYDYAPFQQCQSLSEISFIHDMSSATFQSLSTLQKVWLGYGSLSAYAFSNCNSLESVYIFNYKLAPMSNTNAFASTPMSNSSYLGRFGSIYVPASLVEAYKTGTNWAAYSDRITALPSELSNQYVGCYEFESSTLTEIPSEKLNAEAVCKYAFNSCVSLSSVDLPNCKFVSMNAFAGCTSLAEVSLPSCFHIGSNAFSGCNNLSKITLDECITFDQYAFTNTIHNSEAILKLPKCAMVHNSAFLNCRVKDIFAPNLTLTFTSAFGSFTCSRAIFKNLSSIYPNYFSYFSFSSLYLLNRDRVILGDGGSRTFGYYAYQMQNCYIYVPSALLESYKSAWSYYSNKFVGLTDEEIASIYSEFGYSEADFN